MNIEHLREFTDLAETLSFSATAKHFFLSASVLSKHIAAIEDTLQVRLFERNRHRVTLTDAGRQFYHDCVLVVNAFDHAVENIAATKTQGKLCLRIGYLRGAAKPFLPALVRYMEKKQPNVELEISCMEYGELIHAHRSHRIDAGFNIHLDPEADMMCDSERIYTDGFYLVVGKHHRLANCGRAVSMSELEGERFILPAPTHYPGIIQRYEKMLHGVCDTLGCERYRDIDTMFFRVAAGNAVGFSSGHNARLFSENVRFLPIEGMDTSYEVSAFWEKTMGEGLASIIRDCAIACRESMAGWSDGVSLNGAPPQ